MKQYDVQIKVRGEWQWASVAPATGQTKAHALRICREARRNRSSWSAIVGSTVTAFRVVEVGS